MPVTRNASIAWKNASADDRQMLDNLQPNILKPHTREFLTLLFLDFTDPAGGRAFLAGIGASMKSAWTHLKEVDQFKANKKPGTPYVGLGLTAAGYKALGIGKSPTDPSFQGGMQANKGLNDPAVGTWDAPFHKKDQLHAVLIVADTGLASKSARQSQIVDAIHAARGIVILGIQDGVGQHNANGDGIEHFGYVDGRSQPLYLQEDIADERATTDGTTVWNPEFPLGHAIVPDPAAPDPLIHFGSYFVFRKLEQNVKLFKEEELRFAKDLKLDDKELSGGFIVGRFEDGTPVTLQSGEGMKHPVPNDFDYDSDEHAGKCPFAGHIRKTNPRGSAGAEPPEKEREHLMPRRGQTYGVRTDDPNDGATDNKPTGDVGLLFMAFNSNIANQFEFTQIVWANNGNFPGRTPAPGVDPVIGQTPKDALRPKMSCPREWGSAGTTTLATAPRRAVTMKGGEYFFMPSLAFLRALSAPAATAASSTKTAS